MIKLGNFQLHVISDGFFYLDGGAMFGVVPKVIWQKVAPSDDQNRIRLGLNALLIETPDDRILIDAGIGDKYDEKFAKIFGIEKDKANLLGSLKKVNVSPEQITKVIYTHMHFDHCGGGTRLDKKLGNMVPTFPKAQYFIQNNEWLAATKPNERTRASYLPENIDPFRNNPNVQLIQGEREIVPGITCIETGSHCHGHQIIKISSNNQTALYLGDLIPTTAHLKLPYIMGYDLFPMETLEKKRGVLDQAIKENWTLLFEHDPKIFACQISASGQGIETKIIEELTF
jgi:glyoxylase-like metal-dependent hydrolase (beta-lactamase superfamily II)